MSSNVIENRNQGICYYPYSDKHWYYNPEALEPNDLVIDTNHVARFRGWLEKNANKPLPSPSPSPPQQQKLMLVGMSEQTNRECQRLAFKAGYVWSFNARTEQFINKNLSFDPNDKRIMWSNSNWRPPPEDNYYIIHSDHLKELAKFLNVSLEQPPQQGIVLRKLTPYVSEACQKIAFEAGYKWPNRGSENAIQFNNDGSDIWLESDKFICRSNAGHICENNDDYITISNNHVENLQKLLLPNKPLTTPQPTTTPQPPMASPYEAMVNDIEARLLDKLQNSLPNQERIKELILEEVAKTSRIKLVLEDRRITPPTETTIDEPVHSSMPDLIGIIKSNCWPAIVGPTGGGKTLGVLQCAKLLNIQLVCIKQMTRIIAPHDLIGYMDANGHYRKGAWTDAILGYEFVGNGTTQPNKLESTPALIVVDEMDNANENIIMLIKALQTKQIAMPYGQQQCNPSLQVVATMNTWGTGATREYVGRCAQDAALLNEFQFIEWNYDTAFEWELLQQTFHSYATTGNYRVEHMRRLLDMFIAMRQKAEQQKVRVIISTRNIISVAKLLINNPEWSVHKALSMSVYKGLKEEEIKRVECPEMWRSPAAAKAKQERITTEECPI